MSDTPNENFTTTESVNSLIPTRRTRKNIVVVTLLVMWAMIGYIVLAGDPTNSLHQSALSWGFITSIGVIFGYVFGAVADNWGVYKNMTAPTK